MIVGSGQVVDKEAERWEEPDQGVCSEIVTPTDVKTTPIKSHLSA